MIFADVIVDISHENVDRPFEYIVPEGFAADIRPGTPVNIPFGKGNKLIKGFVLNLKDKSDWPVEKLKSIDSVVTGAVSAQGSMIELAHFIKTNYGSTMNKALKTVMPVKVASNPVVEKYACLNVSTEEAKDAAEKLAGNKRAAARVRVLKELTAESVLPVNIIRDKLNASPAVLKTLEKDGLIRIDRRENLRDVINIKERQEYNIVLNADQQKVADDIWNRHIAGDDRPSLIHGVTGSGKTEVYINLISRVIEQGRQAIVLIPEIALTYQTVIRFYRKFGNRVSVINSKQTPAEKHDQLEKAKRGDVDIIIGPRSALFTPFERLGIIIIDEEHENTYKNENVPRYHSREVAIKRAEMAGAFTVLGSATPSVDTYNKAENGQYALYKLSRRAGGANLPDVEVVDLRDELAKGNRSIISERLNELILDRLGKKEQVILFINRRGYSSFVSCRQCGEAIKCPHCDVSLKYHRDGRLVCHYCGYETPMMKTCPKCGSKYIGTFGTGTQKIEEEIKRIYPEASVLRMDADTTKEKDGHEKILAAFAGGEADILVGTQMIVKGHDFANVTLVGILAADMSLYAGDYLASERTFQLITQAAGRAGRGSKEGRVIIQTYSPDNYAVKLGAEQNYDEFYKFEMSYRRLLGYPPAMNMLAVLFTGSDEGRLDEECRRVSTLIDIEAPLLTKIGPAEAVIGRINDRYRRMIYLKSASYKELTDIKDVIEQYMDDHQDKDIQVTFDFSEMGK